MNERRRNRAERQSSSASALTDRRPLLTMEAESQQKAEAVLSEPKSPSCESEFREQVLARRPAAPLPGVGRPLVATSRKQP